MGKENTQKQIVDLIVRSEKILILPSSPPDGDSLGSAISLYMVMQKLGKKATVICTEPIPEVLKFLPNSTVIQNEIISTGDFIITLDCSDSQVDSIKSSIEDNKVNIIITPKEGGDFTRNNVSFNRAKSDYDMIITVDTAERIQLRGFYESNIELFQSIPVVNIDHHVSNEHFGKINHVDIMAASTTEILLPLLQELSERTIPNLIDEDVATLLLTGIITDTGSFQNANTTPKSFARAAELISYGARQQEIIQHIYKTKQLSQLKLWGRVLTKIQTDDQHRMVWSVVTQQDFKDTQSSEDQTGDIIDELMTNAPGAEVVLLIREKEDGDVSVSVRTTSAAVDGSAIAEHFGGGGHTQAAGFRMNDTTVQEAELKIVEYVRNFQKERLGLQKSDKKADPMINVEELMRRAEEAQKATAIMDTATSENSAQPEDTAPTKKSKKSSKSFNPQPAHEKPEEPEEPTTPGPKVETIYKFED